MTSARSNAAGRVGPDRPRRIAFVGLGHMGSHMCRNLTTAGHAVTAYDLDRGAVRDAIGMDGPDPEKVGGGEEEGQDQAGGGYPPGDAGTARLLLEPFRQSLPALLLVIDTHFGEGVGCGQLPPPGQKLIGSFV